jgi:hypothetical protein
VNRGFGNQCTDHDRIGVWADVIIKLIRIRPQKDISHLIIQQVIEHVFLTAFFDFKNGGKITRENQVLLSN